MGPWGDEFSTKFGGGGGGGGGESSENFYLAHRMYIFVRVCRYGNTIYMLIWM